MGLDNLRLKESDRIAALQSELKKIGAETNSTDKTMQIIGSELKDSTDLDFFDAHSDHRMVMSLAALSMLYREIVIRDPMVVAKSYPAFWSQVEKFVDVRPGK